MEDIKDKIGYPNSFSVASIENSEGSLYWRGEKMDFSLNSYSQNYIYGDVTRGNEKWRFVGIYELSDQANKYRIWNLIQHLCEGVSFLILFGGDFNEISHEEQEGG